MFALVLVGALVSQSLAAPSNCGTASVCDPYSGRQVLPGSSQTKGGYSSYSKWGSSSSWSSGTLPSGQSGNLETFDEGNVIGTNGLNRQGNWRDEKSYVTDDRKGKIDYKAEQEITANSYRKSAESSYRWGTNDYHQAKPNSQIIHSSQFESQIHDVERDMEAFIGQFSFSSGSIVNQQTLDDFRRQAERLTNQITGLCDQTSVNSEDYRRLQNIKRDFERQVQIKQQEIMNFVYESKHTFSGSITSSSSGGPYVSPQPQPHYPTQPIYKEPIYQAPVTVSPLEIKREKVQTECNALRDNIASFYNNFVTAQYNTYDREETLATFRAQVNAQVEAIKQQIANLRVESASFDYHRNYVEEMNKTFETYVANLNQHIKDCEERIRAEQRRLLEEQERLVRERLEREKQEADRLHQESLRRIEEEHARQQKKLEEEQRIEEAKLAQRKIDSELEWRRKQEMAERVTYAPRPQPPSLPQIKPPVQTVTPNVDGSWQVHFSGSQHHQVSGSSVGGGSGITSGQQIQYQPSIGPHIDFADIQNKMNQEFNRLVSSVHRLSSYSMQLTESNQQSINAQFQRDADELRRKIESLCQESSQYNNDHIFKAAEELKQNLEQTFQYFQQELAKVSASGSFQDNSSWGASGRYTHVRQPQISNVEFSHQKSTEIEVSHGGRGNAGQQQVICVEQYANQPCIEPVRVRREAGGYYSQQHESNLDEYTPRRRNHRRPYESEVEDYSQQHVDPQLELDDYSQRTGQGELPRNQQEHIQSGSYRRRGETESHNLQQVENLRRQENVSNDHYSQRIHQRRPYSSRYGQQETEDLSQQYVQGGQSEDLQSYQKPRNQRLQDSSQQYIQSEDLESYQKPRSARLEESSQQYVQSGQSEDLQSYQKPRNERIRDESQQYVQSGQSEDLQSYQRPRSQRIEDSSQQYVQNGESEDLQSYQRPRNQRSGDSSQRYVQSEDLQSYQKPRNERIRDESQQYLQSGQGEDLQSYQRPRNQRIHDESQQYVQSGQSEDLQTYQRPRSQRTEDFSQQYVQNGESEDLQSYQRPRNERIHDESQQYVQSGQSEDLQSYQRPRSQRTEDFSQQYVQNGESEDLQSYQKPRGTQQIHAANLQREQSSASTGRTLLDQRLVVDEPQDIVKPIVKPGKLGSTRGVNDYSLDNSGFYDNPKLQENSKLNDNLQQSYERPSQTQTIETHGKLSDEIQKPRGSSIDQLTLENSGFDNYQKQNEQYSVTESPTEQVTTFKNLAGSQQLEDLTLQKSGFFENAGQGQNLETSESRQNEDLVQNDDKQQSSVQMNLGPEVQPGRGSNLRPERINPYNDRAQQNLVPPASSTQNHEYGQREHPVGQYIHNLPQQNRPSSPNIIDLDSNEPNIQYVNADNQDKVLPLEEQQSSVTAYPPPGPAPKPAPRYTRPWQVSQNINVPQRPANEYLEQSENLNTNFGSNSPQNSNASNRHLEPQRGDLPGRSEPTTEEPVYIPPQSTPAPTVRPTTQAPITEEPKQATVEPEVPTQRTPCFFNRCQNNQFDDLSQTYYFRQQHQQNIRFSQQSTYNNQQNLGLSVYQRQNPFYQQNSQSQFNQQQSPVNYAPEHGYTFRYRDQQTNHLSINHQGSTLPTEPISFEQSDLLGLNGQESSQQQVQKPSFGNSSGPREFRQHHSTVTYNQQNSYSPDDEFPARVIPLDEAQSRNIWANVESTTRPTFWKRVGHKISNTYEKVKESARTVYG